MGMDTWGKLGYLTAEQEAVLDKVKQHVDRHHFPPAFHDDRHLLRFCRARKFKTKLVINMLNGNRKFVEEYGGRPLGLNEYPGIKEYFSAGIVRVGGYDKAHRPIIYFTPGLCFPARLGFCQDGSALRHFFAYYFTGLARMSDEKNADGWNFVIDLKGWTFANFSMTYARNCLSILQDHFPERLTIVHVVFAPAVFKAAWRILSTMMEPRTRQKFRFISAKEFGVILDFIDRDVLEKAYGGEHEPYPTKDRQYRGLVGAETLSEARNKILDDSTASAISLFEELIESEQEVMESKTSEFVSEKRSRYKLVKSKKSRVMKPVGSAVDEITKQQRLLGALKALEKALHEESKRMDERIIKLEQTTQELDSKLNQGAGMLQRHIDENNRRWRWMQLVLLVVCLMQAGFVFIAWQGNFPSTQSLVQ